MRPLSANLVLLTLVIFFRLVGLSLLSLLQFAVGVVVHESRPFYDLSNRIAFCFSMPDKRFEAQVSYCLPPPYNLLAFWRVCGLDYTGDGSWAGLGRRA